MKGKRFFTILLAVVMFAALSVSAGAASDAPGAYFFSVTGTVVAIEDYEAGDGWYIIELENAVRASSNIETGAEATEDRPSAFIVTTDRTAFAISDLDGFGAGDIVTAFIRSVSPMFELSPPQYTAEAIVAGLPDGINVKADRFAAWDNDNFPYRSYGKGFAFAVDENTEIILADGSEFDDEDGKLFDRKMIVIYGASTKSLPELATALEVVVLFEEPVTGPEPIPDDMLAEMDEDDEVTELGDLFEIAAIPIRVDGVIIEAPAAYIAEDGVTVMVPIRPIIEALDFELIWIPENFGIQVNGMLGRAEVTAKIAVGEIEAYQTYARRAEVKFELSVAPELVDARTYVPLRSFFKDVLGLSDAYVFEGVIELTSVGEAME